jgi:hypothetical protein
MHTYIRTTKANRAHGNNDMVFGRESGHRACFVVEVPLFSQDKDQVVGLAIYRLGPSKGDHFSELLNDNEQEKLTRTVEAVAARWNADRDDDGCDRALHNILTVRWWHRSEVYRAHQNPIRIQSRHAEAVRGRERSESKHLVDRSDPVGGWSRMNFGKEDQWNLLVAATHYYPIPLARIGSE